MTYIYNICKNVGRACASNNALEEETFTVPDLSGGGARPPAQGFRALIAAISVTSVGRYEIRKRNARAISARTDTRVKRKKERRGKTVPLSDEEEVVFQPVQPPRLLITLRFLRFIYFHCETFVFHFYEPNHFSEKLRVPSLSHLVEGREFVGKSFSGPSRKLGNGMI